MKLLLIRHGQTAINVKGVTHTTNDPAGLSELGKEQAKGLIHICQENKVQQVYSSPETRAIETATIIANGLQMSWSVLQGLRERNWGMWEGKPWEEIKAVLDPMSLEERYLFTPPDGESWKQLDERLKTAIDSIIAGSEEAVAIVTHEGALRALVTLLNNAPKETSFHLHFDNGSVTVIDSL
jgi:broad specificity phosphatase PhoE